MRISKAWAMPNKHTFSIPPIKELVERTIRDIPAHQPIIVDPFAGNSMYGTHRNDLDVNTAHASHCDAIDFLRMFDDESVDMVLFDPPYSPRQVSEHYKKAGMPVNMTTTQATYWTKLKAEISRITKLNGVCITFGWNSGGVGKTLGFNQVEILLVAHGGWHNDTICTVERKVR